MNILNLYHSQTGNTEKLALRIGHTAEALGHTVATLRAEKELDIGIISFDFVFAGYVLNVLPPDLRKITACAIQQLTNPKTGTIILGLRDDQSAVKSSWQKAWDGFITPTRTFQTFYPNSEISQAQIQKLFLGWAPKRLGRGTWLLKPTD